MRREEEEDLVHTWFIKHMFVTHSTASECMCNEIKVWYDKTIIITVSSYTGKCHLFVDVE